MKEWEESMTLCDLCGSKHSMRGIASSATSRNCQYCKHTATVWRGGVGTVGTTQPAVITATAMLGLIYHSYYHGNQLRNTLPFLPSLPSPPFPPLPSPPLCSHPLSSAPPLGQHQSIHILYFYTHSWCLQDSMMKHRVSVSALHLEVYIVQPIIRS